VALGQVGGEMDGQRPLLDALAAVLGTALSVPLALISVVGPRGQDILGAHGLPVAFGRVRAPEELIPLCRQVVLSAKPVIVHDVRRRVGAGSRVLATLGVVGYAGVPILVRGVAVGVIAAADRVVRAWSERDIDLLRELAEVAAASFDRDTRLDVALARERSLTALLVRAATATSAIDVLDELARHTGWPCADIVTIEDGQLRVVAWHASDRRHDHFFRAGSWPVDGNRFVREALVSGEATWLSDLRGQERFVSAERIAAVDLATGFALAMPGYSAVLELFTSEATVHRAEVARVASAIVPLLGPMLVRLTPDRDADRRTGELELLALHDELTGLLNRRGFYAVAGGQLAIARRKRLPGLVLFVDVDGLKELNDRDGHSAGDTLLRRAAAVLRATFRDSDSIGRVGGDEFVVFSVDATEQDVEAVTSRLAMELERLNTLHEPAPGLYWSVGFVAFEGAATDSLDALVVEADRRMYETKRRTRQKQLA